MKTEKIDPSLSHLQDQVPYACFDVQYKGSHETKFVVKAIRAIDLLTPPRQNARVRASRILQSLLENAFFPTVIIGGYDNRW